MFRVSPTMPLAWVGSGNLIKPAVIKLVIGYEPCVLLPDSRLWRYNQPASMSLRLAGVMARGLVRLLSEVKNERN